MVNIKVQFLLLALATLVMACLLSSHQAAAELDNVDNDVKALTRILCCGDLIKLYRQCKEYVKKDGEEEDPKKDGDEEDPSEECCSEVQNADLPCICQYIPPVVERFIDMEKLANVAEKCKRPLPSGTKCGSYTVPTFQLAKKKLPPPPPPKIQEERKVYPPPPPRPPPKIQEERKVYPPPPPPPKIQEERKVYPPPPPRPPPKIQEERKVYPPPPPPPKIQEERKVYLPSPPPPKIQE